MIKQDIIKTFCSSNHIVDIIIYPGYNAHVHGYNNKYDKIANMLQQRGIGTVIQSSNYASRPDRYPNDLKNWLRYLITKSLVEQSPTSPLKLIYLMGISAGASACAAVAYEFPEVTKMLLIAPSSDAGYQDVSVGMEKYKGELYVTSGKQDEVVGQDYPEMLWRIATMAKHSEYVAIDNCDHQYRGEENGKIFSQAPLWAFAGDHSYSDSDKGIKLYD